MNKERALIWVGVVVVILGVALFFTWKPENGMNTAPVAGPNPTYAPQGQMVQGFPKELILDKNPTIGTSYTINYNMQGNQYTAEWNSSSSLADLKVSYKSYFAAHGWTVNETKTASPMLGGVSAATSTANVLVSLYNGGSGTTVTVTYVKK